ncbi:MAG: hypothetical protein V3S89_12615 [Desulfobacterales bacterium]
MKMKYIIEKGEDKQFVIKESSALDKKDMGKFTLLCESVYAGKDIEKAASEGMEALILAIRTPNFYPQTTYASMLAEAILTMVGKKGEPSVELVIDDNELLSRAVKLRDEEKLLEDVEEEPEDDSMGVDELLDNNDGIKNLKSTILVADEESVDIDIDKDAKIEDIAG